MKTITYNEQTHRLVPVEPTVAIRIAIYQSLKSGELSTAIYRAMLSAAPQPEPVEVEPVACSLPERDTSKTAEQQGLFRKFIIERVDGSDKPGGKHFGCEYFVLDMHHDKHAVDALRAYATSCKHTHPELSEDLFSRFGTNTAPPDYEEIKRQLEEYRKDAERYRAIKRWGGTPRDGAVAANIRLYGLQGEEEETFLNYIGEDLDQAIDAALASVKGGA